MSTGADQCHDATSVTHLKMAAMAFILTAGAFGVCIPFVRLKRQGRLHRTDGVRFPIVKAFAAGVILATGFVHILPGAAASLTDASLPWAKFPFSGFVAMMAALGTFVLDFLGTRFYERRHEVEVPDHDHKGKKTASRAVEGDGIEEGTRIVGIHAHVPEHGLAEEQDRSHERHIVVSQILGLGIASHSVIIGLSLGVSQSPCTIRPLIAALSFHQFFQGFALAGCVSQARFSLVKELAMACFFAVTTPGGIAVGLAVAPSSSNPGSPTAIAVEGILDAVSAGILIYMALVGLIATDFHDRKKRMMNNSLISYVALFSGAGLMSSLAFWA